MALPLTYTNNVPNPAAIPNGLGAEQRRNLVPNPTMKATTALTQIRVNDVVNPSFERLTVVTGDMTTVYNVLATRQSGGAGTVDRNSCLKLQPNNGSNDCFIGAGNLGSRAFPQIANGKTVELSATITIPTPQTGTLHARARCLALFTKNSGSGTYTTVVSTPAPNAPGSYRLSAQITLATGTGVEFFFRLYNGSANANDVVYWDAVMLQDVSTISNSSNAYFDGDSGNSSTIDGTFIRGWAGTRNDSVSTEKVYGINGCTALVGSWSRWTDVMNFTGEGCASVGFNATSATMVTGMTEELTLPAATQHTFSAYVYRPSGAPTMKLRVSGPGMTTADSAATASTETWERISVTFTTVTAGVYTISLRNFAAVTATSSSVLTDAWQVETGGTATSWFAGNSAAPNLAYQWTGTPFFSPSTETGLALPNYTAANASVVSALQGGVNRVAIIPNSASTDSKAYVGTGGPGALRFGLTPGRTYYAQARLTLTAPLTGTPSTTNTRNMTFYTKVGATTYEQRTATTSNVAGDYTHSMVFTVPSNATEAYVSLNNGHPTGGGTVLWDRVMVVDAEYGKYAGWMGDIPDPTQYTTQFCAVSNVTVSGIVKSSLIPNNPSNDSYIVWKGSTPGSVFGAGTQKGRSYTLTYEIQVPAVQTGTLNTNARRAVIRVTGPGGVTTTLATQQANAIGTTTRAVNFTVPPDATAVEIRLYNGAATGGGAVYYNRVNLLDSSLVDYTPNYFDGGVTPVGDHRVSRWLGAPNASASQFLYRGLWIEGDASVTPPRVRFTVAGLGLGKQSSVAIRRLAGEDTIFVPGWLNKNVLDIATGVDWLVPLNVVTQYQLWVDGSQIDTASISYTSPAAWIADPLVPGDAMPIYTVPTGDALQLTPQAMADKGYRTDVETANVIGSAYPIVRAGQRQLLGEINLTVQAPSNVTSDQFYAMVKNTPIFCIRTHPSWGNMPPVIYVAANVTEKPVNRQRGGQFTIWEIVGSVVTPITRGPVVAGVTHAEVQANIGGRTHQQIRDVSSNRRWVDIISDPLSLGA